MKLTKDVHLFTFTTSATTNPSVKSGMIPNLEKRVVLPNKDVKLWQRFNSWCFPIFTASWMLTCWENHQQILWIKPKAIQGHLDDFKVLWFSSTYIFNIIQKNHWNSMLILMWNQSWIQLIHFAKVGRSQLTEGGILLLNVASVINKCCLNKTVASNISKCRLNWTAASNINKSRLKY